MCVSDAAQHVRLRRRRARPVALALSVFATASCAANSPIELQPREPSTGAVDAGPPAVEAPDATIEPEPNDAVTMTTPPSDDLPPLPPPPETSAVNHMPLPNQPAPTCPPEKGWDGLDCVATTCAHGSRFDVGRGCIRCGFVGCGPDPERRPWSDESAPFNGQAAREALDKVVLSACKRDGGPVGSGRAMIAFHPAGIVYDVKLVHGPFAGTLVGGCIVAQLKSVRIPKFGGSVVNVSRSFSVN